MISVSFLSIKKDLKKKLQELDHMNLSYFHCDIMDGEFVPNQTWNAKELSALLKGIHTPLDIHLMVSDVPTNVAEFGMLKPEFMTFHLEATNHPKEMIDWIHKSGSRAGISIKPNTPVSSVEPYLKDVDLVLVMSVEPGLGGQAFMESSLSKIEKLKELKNQNHYSYLIEVDGGINPDTLVLCKQKGADLFVVGSYITSSDNYEKKIAELLKK